VPFLKPVNQPADRVVSGEAKTVKIMKKEGTPLVSAVAESPAAAAAVVVDSEMTDDEFDPMKYFAQLTKNNAAAAAAATAAEPKREERGKKQQGPVLKLIVSCEPKAASEKVAQWLELAELKAEWRPLQGGALLHVTFGNRASYEETLKADGRVVEGHKLRVELPRSGKQAAAAGRLEQARKAAGKAVLQGLQDPAILSASTDVQDDPAIITVSSSPLTGDFDPAILSAKLIPPVPAAIPLDIKLDPIGPVAAASPPKDKGRAKLGKSAGGKKKAPVVCKYFAESGFCRKAAQCPFSHDVAPK